MAEGLQTSIGIVDRLVDRRRAPVVNVSWLVWLVLYNIGSLIISLDLVQFITAHPWRRTISLNNGHFQ